MVRLTVATCVLLSLAFASCPADTVTGTIIGSIHDKETGEAVSYANVMLAGTTMGAMTFADGTFRLAGLLPGEHVLKFTRMGYKALSRTVRVTAGETVTVNFAAEREIVAKTPVIYVIDHRGGDEHDVRTTHVLHEVEREEFEALPRENITDAVIHMPGVVSMGNNQYSVHGGRPDETKTFIDGVPIDDPLENGDLGVSLFSTESLEFITGGMDAEYGDAQSAILNITTRSGGERFGGDFRYWTDDFGRQDKTYTNYDRMSLGFGGPSFFESVRYYVSGEATFTDTENTTLEHRAEHKVTDWLKFRERQAANYSVQSKMSYNRGGVRVTAEAIRAHGRRDIYLHNWNIEGYARKVYYFQRLDRVSESVYAFAGTTVIPHGDWVDNRTSMRARPVTVVELVRDDATGVSREVYHYNFRAAEIDGKTVVWDEVLRDGSGNVVGTKSWILFEGFQSPYSEFSHVRSDSSFVAFNSAERTPELVSDQLHLKLSLAHTVGEKMAYRLDLSRLKLQSRQTVNDKRPEEYDTAGRPVTLPNGAVLTGGLTSATWYTDRDNPCFVTAYDFPFYQNATTVQYVAKGSVTSEHFAGHRIKSGLQLIYNDLDSDERAQPGLQRLNSQTGAMQQGVNVNIFHNYNVEGAAYMQDKWEYEGMVLNGGLRLDFFSTGNNDRILISNAEIDPEVQQWKTSVSPRLGIAFPITDRDKFFFHYGRFTQWPSRVYLFSTQDPIGASGVLGNPNLEAELNVSYQAGISHFFSDDVVGTFVLFNKDIYGLVTSTLVTDDSTGVQRQRHVNRAYASSRGLEVSLEKRLTRHFGFDAAYTYSFADGVASDADFGRTAEGLTHLPTDELPLDWDQRHTVSMSIRLQDGNKWAASATYLFGSGRPWTPVNRFARLDDPTWENSRRLSQTHQINVRGQKHFRVGTRQLTFFFEGRNLLDDDILLRNGTAPVASPALEVAEMDGGAYLTETGRYGGAYMQDADNDGINEFHPVGDPTVWQSHRVWRVGLGFQF